MAGPEIIGQTAAGHPEGEAVEVAAVSEHGIAGHAAFGLQIMAKSLDVVGQSHGVRWHDRNPSLDISSGGGAVVLQSFSRRSPRARARGHPSLGLAAGQITNRRKIGRSCASARARWLSACLTSRTQFAKGAVKFGDQEQRIVAEAAGAARSLMMIPWQRPSVTAWTSPFGSARAAVQT